MGKTVITDVLSITSKNVDRDHSHDRHNDGQCTITSLTQIFNILASFDFEKVISFENIFPS